jgi:hypothetical protein
MYMSRGQIPHTDFLPTLTSPVLTFLSKFGSSVCIYKYITDSMLCRSRNPTAVNGMTRQLSQQTNSKQLLSTSVGWLINSFVTELEVSPCVSLVVIYFVIYVGWEGTAVSNDARKSVQVHLNKERLV